MHKPALSPQERKLAGFCRIFTVLYALGAVAGAFTGRISAAALLAALATACAVVAPQPRERRHAFLPVVVAHFAAFALAALSLLRVRGPAARPVWALALVDVALFAAALFFYRSAAPGVRGASAQQQGAASAEPAPKVQLGVPKT